MNDNVLRHVETEDVVFYVENQYNSIDKERYEAVFKEMVADGALSGFYSDSKWIGFSGIKSFGIDFSMDRNAYVRHFGTGFAIPYETMQDMLRCYAIFILGSLIFPTINQKLMWIKRFLTVYGERGLKFPVDAVETIQDFLFFIGIPEAMIADIIQRIRIMKSKKSKPRELSHLINYLAIANEINDMYRSGMPDIEFKKWFPIFFWTNITFVIPLRATEMLVTPFECIHRKERQTYITLRRTKLKKNKGIVCYSVEKDYKEFSYEIPDNWVVEVIERYQDLTSNHSRKFLFDHTKYMINKMVSLQSFNMLLEEFVNTYLIGNPKYGYARYATGIKEFEMVTAGDSRPIAMANLYFQDISADICRQLANHSQISTSFGYYTNVSNTIQCASVMRVQRRINQERIEVEAMKTSCADRCVQKLYGTASLHCLSPLRPLETGDIRDCAKENHLHECLGCRYYSPSEDELRIALEERKKKLDDASKQLVEFIAKTRIDGEKNFDTDKLFLETQTSAIRFRTISDECAEEAEYKWRRHRSSQMKSC